MTYLFSAHICSALLAMGMFVGSASAQGGEQANVSPAISSSQAITLTDIEGAKVHTKLVTEMLAQRQGRQGPVTQDADLQINVQPEQRISFSFRATARTPRGGRSESDLRDNHRLCPREGQERNGAEFPIDGAPMTILSWKPVSSTCDVTPKKLDTAEPSKP